MAQPILIVGSGIIGLSIGVHLVREGASVLIFDRSTAGLGTSHAAAGMIAPVAEIIYGEESLQELFMEGANRYPAFIHDLEKKTSLSTDFHQSGSYIIAVDRDDEAELIRLYEFQKKLGLPVNLIGPEEVLHHEPLLSPNFTAALSAPHECFVDNRRLIVALRSAFEKAGGKIIENQQVTALHESNGKVCGITVGGERIQAEHVILASGLETRFEGLPENFLPPLRPVKGQSLDVRSKDGRLPSRILRTIHKYPVYMVPRSDGRLTIGATSEEMGTDARPTAGALMDLIYAAWKILPGIDDMEFVETRVGHRAATRDHAPILGKTAMEGLYIAMGLFRHGILLAPLVGEMMAELVLKGEEPALMKNFGVDRL